MDEVVISDASLKKDMQAELSAISSDEDATLQVDNLNTVGEYFFESDHLAFKNNEDYRKMMQAITQLKAQKRKAIKDKYILLDSQKKALENPMEFVQKIKQKNCLNFPPRQKIAKLPNVDWRKYAVSGNKSSFEKRQLDRLQSASFNRKAPQFNEPWTEAEQNKLEDLLIANPPEPIETRRWEKIAFALGTRTPIQVASRVQKHFLKLAKAGLPIPGRIPVSLLKSKAKCKAIERSLSAAAEQYSEINGQSSSNENTDISDEEEISPELKRSDEYRELLAIKKMLKKREN